MKKILVFVIMFICFVVTSNHAYAQDAVSPVITLTGDSTVSISVSDTYSDAGATAFDDVDGDITQTILVNNSVDTTVPGTYFVIYNAQDIAGNQAVEVTRTVVVTAPEVVLENVIIRDGGTILFSGAVPLPSSGTVDLVDTSGVSHAIDARSVLALLSAVDATSSLFSISNLEYYPSFDSLYLKCITGNTTGQKCDNWQYTVNSAYFGVGMDKNIVSGGETIYVYFGPQYRVVLDAPEVSEADTVTATAEEYDYQSDTWESRVGVTMGLTQPDPNNPWSPIEVETRMVDEHGQVVFSGISVGSYNVGIKEDFYFPTEALSVIGPQVSVSSGGSAGVTRPVFNIPLALAFLKDAQSRDGSFGGFDMYTDWVAIAYSATKDVSRDSLDLLRSYIHAHSELSHSLTDNERHAMALLSLGENPYSFRETDYISPIVRSFDGVQFGDPLLINDDVFALIPLTHAGYTVDDAFIVKSIQFILSKQRVDGSWEGSIDLTSAVIQALEPFTSMDGVSNSLTQAGSYVSARQNNDGGWGNVYSTSWALQASNVLNESWRKNGNTGYDYLASVQSTDGAVLSSGETLPNRIWATSYAIPALLGKSWNEILHSVSKQESKEVVVSEVVLTPVDITAHPSVEEIPRPNVVVPEPIPLPSVPKSTPSVVLDSQTESTLLATASKSGARVPLTTLIGVSVIACGVVVLRFLKYSR